MLQTILRTAAALLVVMIVLDTGASTSTPWQQPAAAPEPAVNHVTAARVEFAARCSSIRTFRRKAR